MTRDFPTTVVLSVSSGRMLCPFSDMHECIEYLVGAPVWTHQLGDHAFADALKQAVVEQHPQLKTFNAAAVTKQNWQQIVKEAVKTYGDTLPLLPIALFGDTQQRVAVMKDLEKNYKDAFTKPLEGKNVIVVK